MKRSLPPLGDLEHELLTILWAQGEMTALAIRKQVARKLKDPTIRTVLRRLEEKGYVSHSVVSGTFIYRAKESAEATAAAPSLRIRKVPQPAEQQERPARARRASA